MILDPLLTRRGSAGPDDRDAFSLRDLFAAAGLVGMMADSDNRESGTDFVVRGAYILADAMLEERAKS